MSSISVFVLPCSWSSVSLEYSPESESEESEPEPDPDPEPGSKVDTSSFLSLPSVPAEI